MVKPPRRTHPSVFPAAVFFAAFAAIAAAICSIPALADESGSGPSGFAGSARCESCHVQAGGNFAHTIHRGVTLKLDGTDEQVEGCETCHGPGAAHSTDPLDPAGIIRFSAQSAQPVPEQNARCLACHDGGARIHWTNSVHERHDIACSDCHNPMARLSRRGLQANVNINETCFACHRQQRSEFNRRSHMPLPEGKISCIDCHAPHGGVTEPLLRTVRLNDTCFECHAEKRGPFVWEHAPVREDCTNCHLPHGSNHDMLLNAPRPMLCQQCHSQLGHPNDLQTRANLAGRLRPDARLIGRSCSNCHVNIHGSNHPSGLKFVR